MSLRSSITLQKPVQKEFKYFVSNISSCFHASFQDIHITNFMHIFIGMLSEKKTFLSMVNLNILLHVTETRIIQIAKL